MVKTRHQADTLPTKYDDFITFQKRRTRSTPTYNSQANGYASDESGEVDTEVVLQRRRGRPKRIVPIPDPAEDDEEEDDEEEEEESRPMRRTRRSGRRVKIEVEEDDEDEVRHSRSLRRSCKDATSSRESLDMSVVEDEGIRRSSRRRKLLYTTFNQNLIDKHMALMSEDQEEESLGQRPGKRKRSREVNSEVEDDGQDMYSRVKRVRPQVKRDMYGMPVAEEDKQTEESSTSETESDEEEEEQPSRRSYFLREHKPRTNLYMAPTIEPKPKPRSIFHAHSPPRTRKRQHHAEETYQSPARRKPSYTRRRRRPAFHGDSSTSSSGSSGGDSSDDEQRFERRKAKSMVRSRNRCLPMNYAKEDIAAGALRDRARIGSSLADVDPMNIDRSVTFEHVGGLGKHVQKLKEMVVFPLLYPEVFDRFKIAPPRGVLFYGPPGTGKTLVARALANECSSGDRKVAFFMRKGADCLSKWVGESERQLRLLFDQAYQMRPAIIFFDEIDGLAPVRSSRQDQIHSSIVSTLLALMDGLDNRGEIVVIGATNRIDSIDPALRRPGRFDREFLFPLPSLQARSQILQIHTREWNPKLCTAFLKELAEKCVGYCGADLRAVCTEAALHALRRRYPQIYTSNDKLELDVKSIEVCAKDFHKATTSIVPTAQRSQASAGRALRSTVRPLLEGILRVTLETIQKAFPSILSQMASLDLPGDGSEEALPMELYSDDEDDAPCIFEATGKSGRASKRQEEQPQKPFLDFTSFASHCPLTHHPRMLLCGQAGQGQTNHLAPAVLHHLERLPVHTLDLPSLFGISAKTPEEACAQVFREARRTSPSIVFMPHVGKWWDVIGDTLRATFLTLLQDQQSVSAMLLLATSDLPFTQLPYEVQSMFDSKSEVIRMNNPTDEERNLFFRDLLLNQVKRPPPLRKKAAQRMLEVLPKAQPSKPRELTESELKRLRQQEASTMRELRLFLRDVLNKLGRDRKFGIFAKPVDIEDVPDYHSIIARPMDLSTMMSKIDLHKYQSVKEFMEDIELICSNALEYNPDKDPQGRAIRHRACALRDTCQAIITNELDPDFEKLCEEIVNARKRRGESPSKDIPAYYHTRPASNTIGQSLEEPSPLYSRRQRDLPAEMVDTHTDNVEQVPKLRQVIKRVMMKGSIKKNLSPWCRPTKRRFRKILVWVDEFGREVKPPNDTTDDEQSDSEQTGKTKGSQYKGEGDGDKEQTRPCTTAETQCKQSPKSQESSEKAAEDKPPQEGSGQHSGESDQEDTSEFALSRRRRTRSCVELNNVESNKLTSPRSRSAGTSPAQSQPPRMHSPRRRNSSAGDGPSSPQRSAGDGPSSPQRSHSGPGSCSPKAVLAHSPHHSPVAKVQPTDHCLLNGAAEEKLAKDEEEMDTSTVVVTMEEVPAEETKPEVENTQEQEREPETEDSPKNVRRTRSSLSSAQREAAIAALEESVPDLVVDEDQLRYLLARAVTVTRGYTVEKLERVYSRISQAVYYHRRTYNKSELTQDIEHIINSCSQH